MNTQITNGKECFIRVQSFHNIPPFAKTHLPGVPLLYENNHYPKQPVYSGGFIAFPHNPIRLRFCPALFLAGPCRVR